MQNAEPDRALAFGMSAVSVGILHSAWTRAPAAAQTGQPITEDRDRAGRPAGHRSGHHRLIETRVGRPLSMREVRETIAH